MRPDRPWDALCTMCAVGPIGYDSQEETRMVKPVKASLVAAAFFATAAGAIQAQNYPSKPVKILERPDAKASFSRAQSLSAAQLRSLPPC